MTVDVEQSGDGGAGLEDLPAIAAVLAAPEGRRLMAHLERRFLAQALAPSASEAELRHREGQRSVVLYLTHLVATARRGASGDRP